MSLENDIQTTKEKVTETNSRISENITGISNGRANNLTQLINQVNDADPFLIRVFTGSPHFHDMKESLRTYAQLQDLGSREDPQFKNHIKELATAALNLKTAAQIYLFDKGAEGRSRYERKRIAVAKAVHKFAKDQLQLLINLDGNLEDLKELKEQRRKEIERLEEEERNKEVKMLEDMQKAEDEINLGNEEIVEEELEKVYKENFYTDGYQAIDDEFSKNNKDNPCISYILRKLKQLLQPFIKTYERLGLSGKHDSQEPLTGDAKELAEKLMRWMTTREVLRVEQEQRLASEKKEEPTIIEIMSDEMHPDEFISLITKTKSFKTAVDGMTCAGIYNFITDGTEPKKLAAMIRLELPQVSKQFLSDLGKPKEDQKEELMDKEQEPIEPIIEDKKSMQKK